MVDSASMVTHRERGCSGADATVFTKSTTQAARFQAGISMVEVMVTVIAANIGIAALVSSFSHYHQEQIEGRARTTALLAAQTVLEGIKASDFDTLLTQYNDVPADDPNGQDKGAFFTVAGLDPPRVGQTALAHGEIIFVRTEKPDERFYGRDLGLNGLPYPDGRPDGYPDGLDLNADRDRTSRSAFSGKFDLNLDGDTSDSNLLGLPAAPHPREAYRSLRCAVRVTYEVLGQIRQIELQTQLTQPIK